jgi:hypothetical protein
MYIVFSYDAFLIKSMMKNPIIALLVVQKFLLNYNY